MSQVLYSPSASQAYRSARGMTKGQRLAVWGTIAGLHVAVLGGLLFARITRDEPPVEKTLMVSLLTEQPAAAPPQVPPPPPPPPPPPTPAPRMITSSRPTPSPITAPPIEEVVRQEVMPQPPAPPQPAPAPAAVAAPVAAVTPPSYLAAYLRNPGPKMPELARRERHEGIVRLRVQVAADGSPDRVTVQKSSGYAELDAAAVEVVSARWKFVPARQGDRAVAGTVDVPIQFKITR